MFCCAFSPPFLRSNLTLLVTEDPLRPFCIETRKYIDILEPIDDQGKHYSVHVTIDDIPQFATVFFIDVETPLYKLGTYQAQSGDVDSLETPIFDSMVFNKRACLEMLGESLSFQAFMDSAHPLRDSTSWSSDEFNKEAWALVATFLWICAPWQDAMAESNVGDGETILFYMPEGVEDLRTRFVDEHGAILVKAIEAWWAYLDSSA